MALSEKEIRDIGARAGAKLLEKCRERAEIVLDGIHDLKEHQIAIIESISNPQKAKEEMLRQINSQLETMEYYPENPLKKMLLNNLSDIKEEALKTDEDNPEPAIEKVAKKYKHGNWSPTSLYPPFTSSFSYNNIRLLFDNIKFTIKCC